MKKYTTSQRLREIMNIKGIKQIDILNKIQPICEKWGIKMGSNDLSQYVTGKVEPSQKKLSVLAEVLETNEVWLMGYDVPMTKELSPNDFSSLDQYSPDMITDDLDDKYNNLTQLALETKISNEELKRIVTGENKLPKPKHLNAIAEALQQDVTDYFVGAGYIESSSDSDLFDSGIRFLLTNEDKMDLCEILYNKWKKDNNNITIEKIYSSLFDSNKEEFSIEDLKNILNGNSNFQFEDIQIPDKNETLNIHKPFDELEVLFDKHKDILTDDDKEYIKFIIEKRKKEIDKELGKD